MFTLTLVWVGLWWFDRSLTAPEDPLQEKPARSIPNPLIPPLMAAPPEVKGPPPLTEEKLTPAAADDLPPTPDANPEPLNKPSLDSETPAMEDGLIEDLDAGAEGSLEFFDPIDEDRLAPDDVEPLLAEPPDLLEPGF